MDVENWGIGIAVGAIFGIFPAWWYCSAMIVNAVAFKGKVIPKGLYVLARNAPGPGLIIMNAWEKRYYQIILKIMAYVWVIGFIIFFQIAAMRDPMSINGVLVVDLVIIPILLLTCIVPAYCLNKFLKRTKRRTIWNQNSPLDNE